MLSGPVDSAWKRKIEVELLKDERVLAVSASITEIETGSFRVEIEIEADEGELALVLESDAAGNVRRVV